jgi:FeS assembly SUF system protein
MNDNLNLNDFIDSSIKLGEEKVFKAGKKLNNASVAIQENTVIDKLKQVFDPEIPVSVYDLGLIYKIDRFNNGNINIEMSLTAPACPVAGELPKEVCEKVSSIDSVGEVTVKLVWDPAWTSEMMSEDAKLLLDVN